MSEKTGNYGDEGDDSLIIKGVPETRGDCVEIERPCPYFNCRFHLWRDVDYRGKIRFNFERAEKIRQREIYGIRKRLKEKEEKYNRNKSEELRRSIEKSRMLLEKQLTEIPESCALDVAEDGINGIKRIAVILGIGAGDLKRIENRALIKLLKSEILFERPNTPPEENK